jgi:N-hydroxyarylamine O-acetyltransferase
MLHPYLDRIGLALPLPPTADSLRRLQLAHLLHVPFEDLDIHIGRPIRMGIPDLFDKIVTRRRGGFCYELNGMFAWLLKELGFEVTYLSASDFDQNGSSSPPFDHLTLSVTCPADLEPDTRWLVDVGYGDTFRLPLRLDCGDEQSDGLRAYRLTCAGEIYQLWERRPGKDWERHYYFTLEPHAYVDFKAMCRYHQTSPASPFPRWRVCTLATPTGRITLDNSRLIVTHNGSREERSFSAEEFPILLREHFGIDLTL